MRISRSACLRLLAHVLILVDRATQAVVLPRQSSSSDAQRRGTTDLTCSLVVDISIGSDGSSQKTLVVPPCLAGVPLQVGVNIDLSDQGTGAQSTSATTTTTTSTTPPPQGSTSTSTSAPSSSSSGTYDPGDGDDGSDCDDDPDDDDGSGSECSDDDDCSCDDDGEPSSSSSYSSVPHTSTSASPRPSSSSPSSNTTDNGGQWYTDEYRQTGEDEADATRAATWYQQDGTAGACGKKYSDADHIVALSWKIFGGNGYDGPSCGKTIHIKTSAGKTGDAVVADECASCPDEYHVDMSTGLFKDLGLDDDTGEYQVQWSCPDCKFEEDPTIGGCKDDPNGQYC